MHKKFTKKSDFVKKNGEISHFVKPLSCSNLEGGCLLRVQKGIFRVEETLMPIELLERIKTLPEGYEQEIVDFLESILLKAAQDHRASSSRRIGIAKGELKYPDDIDFCNDEIAELFGVN